MPALFYGKLNDDKERQLYNEHLVPFKSTLFDHYKIESLAPNSKRPQLGLLWFIRVSARHPHTAIAWHDQDGDEAVILLPGEHDWSTALTLARDVFYGKGVVPPANAFRLVNYEEPYVYL